MYPEETLNPRRDMNNRSNDTNLHVFERRRPVQVSKFSISFIVCRAEVMG